MPVQGTSIQAYYEIIEEGLIGERQIIVLRYIIEHPDSSDWEITAGCGFRDPNKVRPRRKELLDMGIIEEADIRNCSITNRTVHTWRVALVPTVARIKDSKYYKDKLRTCPMCKGAGKVMAGQTKLM